MEEKSAQFVHVSQEPYGNPYRETYCGRCRPPYDEMVRVLNPDEGIKTYYYVDVPATLRRVNADGTEYKEPGPKKSRIK